MTARIACIAVALVAGCWIAGCRAAETKTQIVHKAQVTGSITYRERIALPPEAVIKVQLVDVSRADAPAIELGAQVIQANGRQVPIAFAVEYDTAQVESGHTYAVQARIEVDGQLRFINDTMYPALTDGSPSAVDLVLIAVGRNQ